LTKGLAQIAFSQIDEIAQTGFVEVCACRTSLLDLVLSADHHTAASASMDIVAHRSSQIERRDAIRGAHLDDPPRVDCPTDLVAELGFVTVERIELIGEESLGSSGLILQRTTCPVSLGTVLSDRRALCVAAFVQPIQQALQVRIVEHGHSR